MITTSTPSKGVQSDVHISRHDPSFARESINGRFTFKDSMGTWRTVDDFNQFGIDNFMLIKEIIFEEDTYLIGTARNAESTDVCIARYNKSLEDIDHTWRRPNSEFNWDSSTIINGFVRKILQEAKYLYT